MTAYLIGETTTDPWGRAGYVYLPGWAMADGEDPRFIQDLYAVLGEDWVRKGCFNHYIYLSALEPGVTAAMFDLGFGKERVDALLDIRSLNIPKVEEPSGVIIRKAGPGDNEHLGSLSNTIFRALAKPPNWHPTLPEDWNDLREGWSELADDKEWTIWLALENDQSVGHDRLSPGTGTGRANACLTTYHLFERGSNKAGGPRSRHQYLPYLAWPGTGAKSRL